MLHSVRSLTKALGINILTAVGTLQSLSQQTPPTAAAQVRGRSIGRTTGMVGDGPMKPLVESDDRPLMMFP